MSNLMFVPRLTIPSNTDLNWIKTTYGGYNHCILGSPSYGTGSVLSNCTGYAWGRWRELLGHDHNLSTGNASNWYGHTSDGYQRGSTPKLGAVACWGTGDGHVAIVEHITLTYIRCSESGWGWSDYFRVTDFNLSMYKSGHVFQGFIYLPITYLSQNELIAIIKRRRRYGDI